MFRIKLVMIAVGAVVAFIGFQEFRVSQGTTVEPEAVELSAIEAGAPLDNNHISIGPHIALHGFSVISYRKGKNDSGNPDANTKVTECYYPIISGSHPFMVEMLRRSELPENDPIRSQPVDIGQFSVLVKTKRFERMGQVPDGMDSVGAIDGLVINRVEGLDTEEKRLIQESFPNLDFDKVLILEQGRKPSSLAASIGMMAGGGILAVGGLFWMLKKKNATPVALPSETFSIDPVHPDKPGSSPTAAS